MKQLIFFSLLISTAIGFAQITDENGVSAIGAGSTQLTGKIGVGTATPETELDVNGDINSDRGFFSMPITSSLLSSPVLFGVGSDISNEPLLGFEHLPAATNGGNDVIRFTIEDAADVARFRMWATVDNATTFAVYDRVQYSIFNLIGYNDATYLTMKKPETYVQIGGALPGPLNYKFNLYGNSYFQDEIVTDGNIGIGTDSFVDGSDTYRLSVEGKVRAHAVKVYTDWADYVFEKNYELPTLQEVEQYIKEHGHLKDIPSAEEVEANGIELGEMNKLLLKKIEELTLYTIELKKEIDQLKSVNDED